MMNRWLKTRLVLSSAASKMLLAITCLAAVACSTQGDKPTTMLTKAEQGLATAESHEAKEYAPLALQKATTHLDDAKQDIEDGEYNQASRNLELAIAYSELATTKSEAEQKEKAANEISQGLMNLQRETMQ